MAWLWLNLSLGALFVLAIVGVPLWLVISRPDTGPKPAELAAWRRSGTLARDRHLRRAGAAQSRPVRPYGRREFGPAPER